jgi:probable F420-dependent oxidoreductase
VKVEYELEGSRLGEVPMVTRKVEAMGCDGVLSSEMAHEPFFPLLLAAEHSERLSLGTGVAIAFPRSPMVTAYTAWDLQALSKGRLLLGLGTQVKGHNVRRFSVPWGPPGPRLREYIQALRAIWDCWQNGTKLDFRGEHYTHTLMPPVANPGPIEHPQIPIHISAVNPYMCRLAGELCDGIRLHPISSPKYTREVVLPNVAAGAQKAGRSAAEIDVCGMLLVATGEDEAELARSVAGVRKRIAFYGSTRTYQPIFEQHGWGETVARLHVMSEQGKWDEMAAEITDEMVEAMAVVATWDRLAERIRAFCEGLMTRISIRLPLRNEADEERLRAVVAGLGE